MFSFEHPNNLPTPVHRQRLEPNKMILIQARSRRHAVTPDEARGGGPKSTQTSTGFKRVNLLIGIDRVERCVDDERGYYGSPSIVGETTSR